MPPQTNATFRAGAARTDITPPVGLDLSGGPFGRSKGVMHPLGARALVVEGDGRRLAVLVCDLLGFDAAYADAIRRDVAEVVRTAPEAVMLAATHTHGGPAVVSLRDWGRPDPEYCDRLRATLVRLAQEVAEGMRPARMRAGAGPCPGVAVNRAREDGPVNDRLEVVRFEDVDGRVLAALVHFAVHPVNLHSAGLVTPDYPHYLESSLRGAVDLGEAPLLYLSGWGGDLNPANFGRAPSERNAAETGGRLAAAAAQLWPTLDGTAATPLAARKRVFEVPLEPLPGREELEKVREERRRLLAAVADPSPTNERWCSHRTWIAWAEEALAALDVGDVPGTMSVALQGLRLGDVALVGAPGEPFTEYGLALQAARRVPHVLPVALANGCVGYFPAPWAYAMGRYEATGCPRYIGLRLFQASSGERLGEAGLALLEELAEDRS